MTVVIVGSGLAGLSCAWELAKAGHKVTVLEARDVLGGRTSSWTEDGMPVESGLHKFLGIYRALPRLLREVGVDTDRMLTWADELAFLNPDGRDGDFIVAPDRHPMRTAIGLLANNHFLVPSDKARFATFTIAGIAASTIPPDSTRSRSPSMRRASASPTMPYTGPCSPQRRRSCFWRRTGSPPMPHLPQWSKGSSTS